MLKFGSTDTITIVKKISSIEMFTLQIKLTKD